MSEKTQEVEDDKAQAMIGCGGEGEVRGTLRSCVPQMRTVYVTLESAVPAAAFVPYPKHC